MRTAVIISGAGTNLQAIIDAWQGGKTAYELVLVISNRAEAKGLARAQAAGIPAVVIEHQGFASREAFEYEMDQALAAAKVELIALAGFMRLLTPGFVAKWAGRLINIHPSLLPAFQGLNTHQKAIDYGVRFSGCSVIFVDNGMDSGAIIEQAVVPVLPGDDAQSLAARILEQEHQIFPSALDKVARGIVRLEQGRTVRQEE